MKALTHCNSKPPETQLTRTEIAYRLVPLLRAYIATFEAAPHMNPFLYEALRRVYLNAQYHASQGDES